MGTIGVVAVNGQGNHDDLPDEVELIVTTRCDDHEVHELIRNRLRSIRAEVPFFQDEAALIKAAGALCEQWRNATRFEARPVRRAEDEVPRGWPALEPIGEFRPPPFPVHTLPMVLADFTEAQAEALQCPPDIAGIGTLIVSGSAVARAVVVRARPDHVEPTNIHGIVIGAPSERKTAMLRGVRSPMDVWEREQRERLHDDVARKQCERRVLEARLKAAEQKGDPEAERLAVELANLPRAGFPRKTCGDVTPEMLARLLEEHDERMLLIHDEGGPLAVAAGRYSKDGSSNVDIYTCAWSGAPYIQDRIGRPAPHLRSPALSMLVTPNPEPFAAVASRLGDGFLSRPIYAWPDSRVGYRNPDPDPMPRQARDRYDSLVRRLLEVPVPDDGPREIVLTAAAGRLLVEIAAEIEERLRDDGDLAGPRVGGWGGKLIGNVIRIAGVIHTVEHPDAPWSAPLEGDCLERAWIIGQYAIPHAIGTIGGVGIDPRIALARRIAGWVRRQGERGRNEFSLRDCYSFAGTDKAQTEAALALLIETGYVRLHAASTPTGGRPAGPAYLIRPEFEHHVPF